MIYTKFLYLLEIMFPIVAKMSIISFKVSEIIKNIRVFWKINYSFIFLFNCHVYNTQQSACAILELIFMVAYGM
jgi:hypothetical protein